MSEYRWHRQDGVLDNDGRQVLQIIAVSCTKKFRHKAGSLLVEKLNVVERGDEYRRKHNRVIAPQIGHTNAESTARKEHSHD